MIKIEYRGQVFLKVVEEDQPSNLVQSVCDRAKLKIFFRHFDVNLRNLLLNDDVLDLIQG